MVILHGDHHVASRKVLNELINSAKKKGVKDVLRLNGKTATLTDLIQAFETQSFFGTDRLVVIENLLSRPKSKEKEALIKYLSHATSTETIIWEEKSLTKTQLKSFKDAKTQEFKTPTSVFKFLEAIKSNGQRLFIPLYEQAVNEDAPESIFYLLTRQIRLLLQTTDPTINLPSWHFAKLKRQYQELGEPKVLSLHEKLLLIDERVKTGQSALGLKGELDLLLATL